MLCHVYFDRKTGTVLVPRAAKTEAGYWLDIEPVEQASFADPVSITNLVKRAMEQGEVVVPTPTRAMFPKPVVLAHSTARSWGDFEKRNSQFSILRTADGRLRIERYRKASEGVGVVVDESASRTFADGVQINEVATTLLSMMQSER